MAQNDWGVYKEGTSLWVKSTTPTLELSSADQAQLMSEVDANTLADALSQGGETFKVGRPDDRHPK